MTSRMTFHAFTEFGWADGDHGLWRYPELIPPRQHDELDFWIEMAKVAERGVLDTMFFADAVGMGGFTAADRAAEVREGRMLLWDPAVLIPVLAKFTEHLGFLFTNSILQDHPFAFARRVSTLDHLSHGRVGWNIVTSYSPNAARNFGLDELPPREERYAWADEYARAVYALWEGSWEEGAAVRDAATGMFVDPDLVHPVDFAGERYRIQGPHLTEPTPQRTPVLLQAGGSVPGRSFAARHAELHFLASASEEKLAADIAAVRALAVQAGRPAQDVKFVISTGFIVGSTDEEARRLAADLDAHADRQDALAATSSSIGIDLTALDPSTPIADLPKSVGSGGMSGVLEAMLDRLPKDRVPTVADLIGERMTRGYVIGGPERVADQIQRWKQLGIDGVAIGMVQRPKSLVDFVDQVIPVLQQRGLAQREYGPGTLRHKLMGYGDRLPGTHPAAAFRRPAGP